jgi:hypothetical protein
MDLLTTKRLSYLALVVALVISVSTASSTNPIQAQEAEENKNETFTVVVTLYGVDNMTGNVVTFVSTNNITRGTVLNATQIDLNDTGKNDGIVDVYLTFPNITISAGNEFKACNMVLRDLSIVCDIGHNSPSRRAEYIDLLLQSTKEE